MPDKVLSRYFQLFNEVGILSQLSRAMLEAQLGHGMLLPHFTVLNHLIRVGDGTTPLKLSSALQVPKASLTHTLAGLVKAGYIEMRDNEKDKRSKCINITKAGRAFRDQAIRSLAPDFKELAKEFSVDDVEAMLPALEQLRKILDRSRD
ncbi:MAG: DNA-binding MarR family transcriptional regulator [Granulosicoccus sp.]|jgi:DNA-binding MarR family transcriptional regulator